MPHMANLPWMQIYFLASLTIMIILMNKQQKMNASNNPQNKFSTSYSQWMW